MGPLFIKLKGAFFFELFISLYDYTEVARILSIDYGQKKCGVAVTDPLQIIVSPLKVVKTSSLLSFLEIYLKEEEVEKIVFGYPTHKDGNPTYVVDLIKEFIDKLNKLFPDMKTAFQDENYTSAEAKEIILNSGLTKKQRQDKTRLDKISAVLILQRYLKHI